MELRNTTTPNPEGVKFLYPVVNKITYGFFAASKKDDKTDSRSTTAHNLKGVKFL